MILQFFKKGLKIDPVTWVFGLAILSWLWRWHCGVLLHQLASPVLRNPSTDLTYWLFNYSGLCNLAIAAPFSYFIDSILIISALSIFILFIKQKKTEEVVAHAKIVAGLSILYTCSLFTYILTLNTVQTMHTHYLDGLLLASLPWCFANRTTQSLLWEGVRYFTCWVYSCAFLWKLGRGFWKYPLHGKSVILAENAAYLAQHPHNTIAQIQLWFIENPQFAHILLDVGMLMQAVFFIGFFTKKIDKYLFILPFLFHLLTYILLDVAFWEFLVLQGSFSCCDTGVAAPFFKHKQN
jgi:hypothetical protein